MKVCRQECKQSVCKWRVLFQKMLAAVQCYVSPLRRSSLVNMSLLVFIMDHKAGAVDIVFQLSNFLTTACQQVRQFSEWTSENWFKLVHIHCNSHSLVFRLAKMWHRIIYPNCWKVLWFFLVMLSFSCMSSCWFSHVIFCFLAYWDGSVYYLFSVKVH